MHEDILKIEKRGLGNRLGGRRVEVGVSIASGGSRLRGYGISPRIGMAEGIVWRRRMLGARAAGRGELVRIDMDESEMISLEDTDTSDPWRRRVVKAVRGDMSAAVSVIEARWIEVVYIDGGCVVCFGDDGDNRGLEVGELDRKGSGS